MGILNSDILVTGVKSEKPIVNNKRKSNILNSNILVNGINSDSNYSVDRKSSSKIEKKKSANPNKSPSFESNIDHIKSRETPILNNLSAQLSAVPSSIHSKPEIISVN